MFGQLAVLHRGLAVLAVDKIQQQGVLVLQLLEQLQGLQPDAVGGVGIAVVVHQLLGVAVGGGLLLLGQLTAQFSKAGIHGGKGLQGLKGLLRHIVLYHGGLAGVGIGGDGGLEEGLYLAGVLLRVCQLRSLLVGIVLRQQIQAAGHLKIADLAHGVRGGECAAHKADGQCKCAYQRKQFLFHAFCSLFVFIKPAQSRLRVPAPPVWGAFSRSVPVRISAIAFRMFCSSSSGFSSGCNTTER